jgi:hypothetical protein
MTIRNVSAFAAALLVAAAVAPLPAQAAATIVVVNFDDPGEGFNDPTPAVPVGGNPGTTLGEQRLYAFQFAANVWGATLDSTQTIYIGALFDSLGPNVLGSAGTYYIIRDFPGASFPATWYHSALADKISGVDQAPGYIDIIAQFSSDFPFYLGVDNAAPAGQPDLVVVLLHEFAHGLGFANFVNEATGANAGGYTDVYSQYTLDTEAGKLWSEMTDAERAASAVNFDNVVWTGPRVGAAVPTVLEFGVPVLTVNSPPALMGTLRVGAASFGPPLDTAGVSGDVVLAEPNIACTAITNPGDVSGKIALIDRGTCNFTVKVKNAQDAGAIAVVIADNVLSEPPPGLGGSDPTITIPSARITLADGNAIKGELPGVNVTLLLDPTLRAGADPDDLALLNAPNPVQLGSSISHWDPIAFPNQLMEPAINADLTHDLIPPEDMSLPQMRDVGWFLDENLDGVPDATIFVGQCNSGVADFDVLPGVSLADQVKACSANARNHGIYVSCVSHVTNEAKKAGLLGGKDKGAIQRCAAGALLP